MLEPGDVQATVRELEARREPYALATVVWTRGRSSGKAGDRAVVTADGRLRGWIGGACALGTVLREGQRALTSGVSRVLCIGTPDDFPASDEARVFEKASCASEGSYEVFIEPRRPPTQLVVLGDSPLAATLGQLAKSLGYRVVVGAKAPLGRAEADQQVEGADLSTVTVDDSTYVVVATQGQWDREALRGALATDAPYVALVASARRWGKLARGLREELGDEAVERVRAPAGLDLGPVPHQEIAVAVLAEVVREKATARAAACVVDGPSATDAGAPEVRDGAEERV